MAFDLIPRSFFNMPRMQSIFEEDGWQSYLPSSGLTISEDENKVYVEAAVPGIDPDKVDVTFDQGILWIRGSAEEKEEDKQKKFYRKGSSSFSYRVAVPSEVNTVQEPKAVYKNGIMKITFTKTPKTEPKKIKVEWDNNTKNHDRSENINTNTANNQPNNETNNFTASR